MKLVFDTNVLIAAFIARGTCSELHEYCVIHHEKVGWAYTRHGDQFQCVFSACASVIGLVTILLGLALFAVSLVWFMLVERDMPEFMLLTFALTLFSGLKLLMLGVLGE